MDTSTAADRRSINTNAPLTGLIRELRDETKTFFKEELQLAKQELSEKTSLLSRNTITLAIGGVAAYAGVIVFLAGIGLLLSFAFEKAGMTPILAGFLGLAIIGLLIVLIGGALVLKSIKTLSKGSLVPEKTKRTLQEFTGKEPAKERAAAPAPPKPRRSPAELEADILRTENQIDDTLQEITRRLSRPYIEQQVKHKYEVHPYRWNGIALAMGLMTGFALRAKIRHLLD